MEANFRAPSGVPSPGATRRQSLSQAHVHAVSQEPNENMRFDAVLQLMKDRSQAQIIFEVFKGSLHLRELDVKLSELLGIFPAQIAPQQDSGLLAAELLAAFERAVQR